MLHRCQAALQGRSGLATDQYVNTWYFEGPSMSPAEYDEMSDVVIRFYNATTVVGATPRALSNFIAKPMLSVAEPLKLKWYRMEDLTPRIPVATQFAGMGSDNSESLPHEVAIAMSYRAVALSGSNPARRRGRLFLGPLNVNALESDEAQGTVRPSANVQATIPLLALRLWSESLALGQHWCIHSPTSGPLNANDIATVYVDNAFDTQRSRGAEATSRITQQMA